jgi:secreted Zn-dependent insulinase-like peptidase
MLGVGDHLGRKELGERREVLGLGMTGAGGREEEQELASAGIWISSELQSSREVDGPHLLSEPENCRLWCRKGHVFSKIAFTVAVYHLAITSSDPTASVTVSVKDRCASLELQGKPVLQNSLSGCR